MAAALSWNAWNRPSPDLPHQLRARADAVNSASQDPNFSEQLPKFLKKGKQERPSPDLPSELRMMKYKNMAVVERLAAKEVKSQNPALAEELEDIAAEIEESHEYFVKVAQSLNTKFNEMDDYPENI